MKSPPPIVELDARTSSAGRSILFLAHRVPYPPDKGDRIRSYHLLTYLARLGRVDLAFPAEEPVALGSLAALRRICRRVETVPNSRWVRWARAAWSLVQGRSLTEGLFDPPGLGRLVSQWQSETSYDAVVVFSSGVLRHALDRGLESRLVTDLVDVDSQKWFDYAALCRGPIATLFRLEGQRVQRLERRACQGKAVVVVTEAEAAFFRSNCPNACPTVILNGVDLDFFQPASLAAMPAGIVFVGQLDYRANVLGLEWFCEAVWPAVRSRLPDAEFRVVGRNPVAAVRRLAHLPGVDVVGTVPDVRPFLARARVVVVPLPVARGVQNKVLEAMAMARAVVASPAALEGLPLVTGRDALCASEPNEWVNHISVLWEDLARCQTLGRNARRYVEKHHHWDRCLAPFDALIDATMLAGGTAGLRSTAV